MVKRIRRITLEATEDPARFTARIEGGDEDTEGHVVAGRIDLEPLDPEEGGGEPTYRVTVDGEDVEGHGRQNWSDRRLKRDITPVEW